MKFSTLLLFLFMPFLFIGCVPPYKFENNISILLNNEDIEFIFPKDKKVLVYHYEINDYENFEKDNITYKRIYVSNEINKEMKKIIVENYKSKKIISNHAYYLLLGEQGLNKKGVGFTSVGFCLHNKKILTKLKNEETSFFIKKCHAFN